RYAGPARSGGAVAALTTRLVSELPCVVVADVQTAFGRVARAVIDRSPGLTVIAITGSSGKTTTKDLLAHVLSVAGVTVAPVDSLNGEIGVPLTVCRVTLVTRFLVAEMGARGIGHLTYLTGIAPPHIGVVLNVGRAHAGEFGSRENTARAKAELVAALPPQGLAVLNGDDPLVRAMARQSAARVVLTGEAADADVRAVDVVVDDSGRATFTAVTPAGSRPIHLRLVGRHHVGNALAVLAVALECGLRLDLAGEAIEGARPVSRWRMEVIERPDGVTVVNDAYNANPDSMAAALTALAGLRREGTPGRRWAVLGQMLELGAESDAAHAEAGALAASLGIERVVAVGPGARAIGAGATQSGTGTRVSFVADSDAAYRLLSEQLRDGDVVLLKSSRDAGLRWLGDRLVGLEVPS
ncbi:MAG TPA: UDP-N-acetylmuramoyl-tripeptide--D-alanyl-D-alanine ligase, partial [Candidatus Lustribacter sp.]|nr:UDP-N-acetylmuramoyl-tripeptide--D-alanyl-D-alanine ligase [Candidatus Lustribacter sp.]